MDGYIQKSEAKKIGSHMQIGRREGPKEIGTEEGSLVWLEEDTVCLACKLQQRQMLRICNISRHKQTDKLTVSDVEHYDRKLTG